MPTHYEVLGVSPGCADTEIKQAYRSALLRLHPDKQLHAADLGSTDATDLQFRLVQEAWQVPFSLSRAFWLDLRGRRGARCGGQGGPRVPTC